MASTIDFSTLDDQELLYGYQRVNRDRFPENFRACTQEVQRRGLSLPERFEIDALGAESALAIFQKLGDGLSTLASVVTRRSESPQA